MVNSSQDRIIPKSRRAPTSVLWSLPLLPSILPVFPDLESFWIVSKWCCRTWGKGLSPCSLVEAHSLSGTALEWGRGHEQLLYPLLFSERVLLWPWESHALSKPRLLHHHFVTNERVRVRDVPKVHPSSQILQSYAWQNRKPEHTRQNLVLSYNVTYTSEVIKHTDCDTLRWCCAHGNWALVEAVLVNDSNLYHFYTTKIIFYHYSLLDLLSNVYDQCSFLSPNTVYDRIHTCAWRSPA